MRRELHIIRQENKSINQKRLATNPRHRPAFALCKGFTLIEMLIYIAIIGAVVVSFISFSISISNSRNKTYVTQEVQANTRMALELISQKIRAAIGVNFGVSTFNNDPGVLSLSMADGAKNPTIINLNQDDGILQITEGSSGPIAITSNKVKVTNLIFTNLTSSGGKGNIGVSATIEYNNTGSDINYTYAQSWQTAVSIRQ